MREKKNEKINPYSKKKKAIWQTGRPFFTKNLLNIFTTYNR